MKKKHGIAIIIILLFAIFVEIIRLITTGEIIYYRIILHTLSISYTVYKTFFEKNAIEASYTSPASQPNSFSFENYDEYIQAFPSDKVLGEIPTADIALEKAKQFWVEQFGTNKRERVKPEKVYYNSERNIWFVNGYRPKISAGKYAYLIIQKSDGKVLASWQSDG